MVYLCKGGAGDVREKREFGIIIFEEFSEEVVTWESEEGISGDASDFLLLS